MNIKTLFCLLLMLAGISNSQAQVFNGKNVKWELSKSSEPRLKLTFGTTGINIGGYEGTSLITENLTGATLFVEVKMTIRDLCNGVKERKVTVSLKPFGKVGGSTWMGGSEQLDYTSPCKERKKWGENFNSKISDVQLEIVEVRDLSKGKEAIKPGTSTGTGGSPAGAENNPGSKTEGVIKNSTKACPTFTFKINTPGISCVALEWFALSTKVNTVTANGEFKQSNSPEAAAFTIQYRKQGDINWLTDERSNGGRNLHTLTGLDACTKYEVRMITSCDNGTESNPSPVLRFTTACTVPGDLKIENIGETTAQVSGGIQTMPASYPCQSPKIFTRVIEFKTNTTSWDEVICNTGSPCMINALSPGTTYRVRARYKYPNNIYSEYTNEASFTTKGEKPAQSPE